MIERATIVEKIFEQPIGTTKYKFFLSALADMDDEAGIIEIEVSLTADRQEVVSDQQTESVLRVKVKAQITNPLEIVVVLLLQKVLTDYGVCVAAGLIQTAGHLCFKCYNESKADMASMPLRSRCRDVFSRLRSKSQDAEAGAKQALTHCVAHAALATGIEALF